MSPLDGSKAGCGGPIGTNGSKAGAEVEVGSRLIWVPCLERNASEAETSVHWVGQSLLRKKMPILDPSAVTTVQLERNHVWMITWETNSSHKLHLLVESEPPL